MAGLKDLVATGLPGDDLLVGPDKVHDLTDAFRLHIEQMDPSARPTGSLVAVTCRTGKSKCRSCRACRFDSTWVSDHFQLNDVEHDLAVDGGPLPFRTSQRGASR